MTRPDMLWRWNFLQGEKQKESPRLRADFAGSPPPSAPLRASEMTDSLFGDTPDEEANDALEGLLAAEYTQEQKLRYEREILEVCVSGHPLDFLPRNGAVWSDELEKLRGKRVTLCGWVVTYRHVGTKNYRNMMFVTLEDQRGVYEAVLFPEAYDKYGGLGFETRAGGGRGGGGKGGQVKGDTVRASKNRPLISAPDTPQQK